MRRAEPSSTEIAAPPRILPWQGEGAWSAFVDRGLRAVARVARLHWLLIGVLSAYIISAFIVPTMAPVAVGDDWVYTRSVEYLVLHHQLKVLDLAVVTLIFQIFWGGLFAFIFGMSFGIVRVSTLAVMFLSGIALYGLCRELNVSRGRSALGTAVYLFNPLAYVLGFTFMTDPHFTAWLVISTYFYARGLRPGRQRDWATLAGSAAAAAAFLIRQEGAFVPLAVTIYLLISRRLWWNRKSLWLFLRVVAIPAIATVLYYIWLLKIRGVPVQQQSFIKAAQTAGVSGTWQLTRWLTFIELMYLGLFALPITIAALFRLPRLFSLRSSLGVAFFLGWSAIVIGGVAIFGQYGHWHASTRMPYIPQYLTPWQLGPPDIKGGRPWFIPNPHLLDWVTRICVVSSLILGLMLCRKIRTPKTPDRAVAGLIVTVGLWQVVGVIPPSYHFRTWAVSMDRYLLPLLPFIICLALWAVRDLWLPTIIAWLAIAAYAIFSVAGTRDFLVFQEATWNLAKQTIAAGIPDTKLDAGAAWDGNYRWEYDNAHHIGPHTKNGPWWVYLFAPSIDSSYIISTTTNWPGYVVVKQQPYHLWLTRRPTYLYLLRKQNVRPPPKPIGSAASPVSTRAPALRLLAV